MPAMKWRSSRNSARSGRSTSPPRRRSRCTKSAARSGANPVSDIEVRPITDAEIADYLRSVRTAFHVGSDVNDGAIDFFRQLNGDDLERRLGAFVDGALCGTAGTIGVELTVPGGLTVPMAAVTQV